MRYRMIIGAKYRIRGAIQSIVSVIAVAVLVVCGSTIAHAQNNDREWKLAYPELGPSSQSGHAMAYDSARGVIVMFGGFTSEPLGETWEWNGESWNLVSRGGPEPRGGARMTFDRARGVCVLFGGYDHDEYYGDTWEWDGSTWTQVADTGPEPRDDHAMAYDRARGLTIMFGGGRDNNTWAWDGFEWKVVASEGPENGRNTAMAYDSRRERVVLYGGWGTHVHSRETWEWDGDSWEKIAESGPSGRWGHQMTFDSTRGVTIMCGGADESDMWEWNGVEWTLVEEHGPRNSTYWGHAVAFDQLRDELILYGGIGNGDSTWRWNRSDWIQLAESVPASRRRSSMVFHERERVTLLFGGVSMHTLRRGDTWVWDGVKWELVTKEGPSPRSGHAMVYDSDREVVVLFGGSDEGGLKGDTWEWDANEWRLVSTDGPSPRATHAMAYDRDRGVVVLFGGDLDQSETWEWDGVEWRRVATTGPRGRWSCAMAYHEGLKLTVLHGGRYNDYYDDPLYLDDTWVWDGASWQKLDLIRTPGKRSGHTMVYDPIGDEIVTFGGTKDIQQRRHLGDTWILSKNGWYRQTRTGPANRSWYSMCYARDRDAIVFFGGNIYSHEFKRDTWEFNTPGIHLDAFTSCPQSGPARIQWSGATPGGKVAILYSLDVGSFLIPNGLPCAGTRLELAPKKILGVWQGPAGPFGRDAIDLNISSKACRGALQLIDFATCDTSNVEVID